MAADLGNTDAVYEYGRCLAKGLGIEQDEVSAARYFKVAADLGNNSAMCEYASCLAVGRGVTREHVSAARYSKESADLSDADAMWLYGLCLENGWGFRRTLLQLFVTIKCLLISEFLTRCVSMGCA
jgi:TPR repeat protein